MSTDPIPALEALLAEAEAAHGVYEATELNGVYDEAWPRWYAAYAIDHGIAAVLARDVDVDELAESLETIWSEAQREDRKPAGSWAVYTARRLAGDR